MGSEPVRCPGCSEAMVLGVGGAGNGRQYECDHCGSTVAGVAVFRRLLGDAVVSGLWSGQEVAPDDHPVVCAFCRARMSGRQPAEGHAAVCHLCQVMWLDSDAMESLVKSVPVPSRHQAGVMRCENCGAAVVSPMDDKCRYCGSALAPDQTVVFVPTAGGDGAPQGTFGRLGRLIDRALGGVAD